jgi:hypothetical protein
VDSDNLTFKLYVFMAHCMSTNKFTVADYTQYNSAQWILPPSFPLRSNPSRIQNFSNVSEPQPLFSI